jgi:hypothetical protein
MFTQTVRPKLRCDRCGHHHSWHGATGCQVCKHGNPDERCTCQWYVGELPAVTEAEIGACPHEVQVDFDPTLCVYCGKKIPRA